jgi:hypothetical protein
LQQIHLQKNLEFAKQKLNNMRIVTSFIAIWAAASAQLTAVNADAGMYPSH